jgi:hypothetical protein
MSAGGTLAPFHLLAIDTHADTHVAGVIDPLGRHLGQSSFDTTVAGFTAAVESVLTEFRYLVTLRRTVTRETLRNPG